LATKSVEWLAPHLARLAEKKPQHFPDSLKISIDSAEQLKGRGNDPKIAAQVEDMVDKVRAMSDEPKLSTGPTPYEKEKAQEDAWE
jgi:hypothetical protein